MVFPSFRNDLELIFLSFNALNYLLTWIIAQSDIFPFISSYLSCLLLIRRFLAGCCYFLIPSVPRDYLTGKLFVFVFLHCIEVMFTLHCCIR